MGLRRAAVLAAMALGLAGAAGAGWAGPPPVAAKAGPSMSGDWRALSPPGVEAGRRFRALIDVTSIERRDGLARVRLALLKKEPFKMPDGGPPLIGQVVDLEFDCARPRLRLHALMMLRGPPVNGLEALSDADDPTDWEEDGASAAAGGELFAFLRKIACGDAPLPAGPGAADPIQARDAWVATPEG